MKVARLVTILFLNLFSPFFIQANDENIFDLIKQNQINKISLIVNQNPDIVFINDKYQRTPLHTACYHGKHDLAQLLIEKGSKINTPDEDFDTPLHDACQQDHKETIDLLLTNGADPCKPIDLFKEFKKYTPSFISIRDNFFTQSFEDSWNKQRLLWIGNTKESEANCHFAKLPPEMIATIQSFLVPSKAILTNFKIWQKESNQYRNQVNLEYSTKLQ